MPVPTAPSPNTSTMSSPTSTSSTSAPPSVSITNFANLARFSRNCGAEIPRWICQRIEGFGNDQESIRQFGIDVVTQLCQTLLESGAPGLHFYTMNQIEPTRQIRNNLGL